jgi:hypothetical protein
VGVGEHEDRVMLDQFGHRRTLCHAEAAVDQDVSVAPPD